MRAAEFVDTLGVVTHVNSYPYDSPARIDAMLDYLGIHNIRQNSPINAQSDLDLAELGRLGARIDLLINGNGPVQLHYATDAVAKFLPWLNAVELPNEVDIFPIGYAGLTGMTAVMRFQQDVYAAIRANPAYDHLDVYGFSVGGYPLHYFPELRDMSPYADFANVHAYAARGNTPIIDMPNSVRGWRQIAPSDPVVVTETGYYTSPAREGWGHVSENVQAQYLLDTAFGNASRGIARTYFYDLINDGPDPQERENNFGFFRFDGSAKPVATAFHNLTAILADDGPAATSFGTEAVAYSVAGLDAHGGSMLLEKSDGTHMLAVWNEQDLWNENTETEIAPTPREVRINLDRAYGTVLVFDPMLGTAPVAAYDDASTIPLTLGAHPLIVQFSGGLAAGQGAPAPASDRLVLRMSEDAFQGHAQFTVSMDGQQLGGVHTVTASHGARQAQEFSFTGHFNDANSRITVNFLNDAFTPGLGDRNIYVEQILLNGSPVPDGARILYGGGPAEFYLPAVAASLSANPQGPASPPPPVAPPVSWPTPGVPGAVAMQASGLKAVGLGDGQFTRAPGTDGLVAFTFTDASGTVRQTSLGTSPRVDFADGWVEFSGAGEGATVARLYRGILGRDPDAAGLAFQVDAYGRLGAAGVAEGMLASPEGQVVANSAVTSYVSRLYQLQLGRAPEQGAAEYWATQLGRGESRANMAASIATSGEAHLDRLGLTGDGLVVSRLEALEVYEAYVGVLGRRAESAGLAFWVDRREEGATKTEIAHALAGSAEFNDRFGALTSVDFVNALYRNALGREADPEGAEYYRQMLADGRTRADLAASFQESPEAAEAALRLAHTGLDLL